MPQLYTISFTTQTLIKKYSPRGKLVTEVRSDNPIVITALSYQTAMSYSKCDNFKIEPYVFEHEPRFRSKGAARDGSVGNGTRRVKQSQTEAAAPSKSLAKPAQSSVATAAQTGNLGAALNV